ncbi:MAG: DNA primase [Aeriscardovia sp.]|nr:DNA primase [Aeriscardovia sp.]
MASIPKAEIDEVREACDLYDIVSETVSLKKSGPEAYVGLCPFHDEKTPSFSVRPSLGTWHCFGCGEGGDVFDYIEKRDGVEFQEAVKMLADRCSIPLHLEEGKSAEKLSTRTRLLEVCGEAELFFRQSAEKDPEGHLEKFLAGRDFTMEQGAQFGCGWAPNSYDALLSHLVSKGFAVEEAVDAGLARKKAGGGAYDYFRGRVIWPISDSAGSVIGFGARRVLDEDKIEAKYINTPETPLYKKSRVLFGLSLAKEEIISSRSAVVVEGYTDVMAMRFSGVKNAVAACGTAFGYDHAQMLRRLIQDDAVGKMQLKSGKEQSRVIFAFDGDEAGKKATLKATSLDSAFLSQTFVARAENGLDPCDLRMEKGEEAVRDLIKGAKPIYDFIIDRILEDFEKKEDVEKAEEIESCAGVVSTIKDAFLRELYTQSLTSKLCTLLLPYVDRKVAREVLLSFANKSPDSPELRGRISSLVERAVRTLAPEKEWVPKEGRDPFPSSPRPASAREGMEDPVVLCEQQLMAEAVQRPGDIDADLWGQLDEESFSTPVFRAFFTALEAAGGIEAGKKARPKEWVEKLMDASPSILYPVIPALASSPLPPSSGEEGEALGRSLIAKVLELGIVRKETRCKKDLTEGKGDVKEILARVQELEKKKQELRRIISGEVRR